MLTFYDNGQDEEVMTVIVVSKSCWKLIIVFLFSGISERWRRCEQRWKVSQFTVYMKSMYDDFTNIKNILWNRMIIRVESQTQ